MHAQHCYGDAVDQLSVALVVQYPPLQLKLPRMNNFAKLTIDIFYFTVSIYNVTSSILKLTHSMNTVKSVCIKTPKLS